MSNTPLVEKIEKAREKTLRFYISNLHAHSPGSHDYGTDCGLVDSPNCSLPDERDLSPEQWVEKAKSSGVEVLAITDHNKCGWGCEAAQFSSDAMTVFPGCEISVKENSPLIDQVVHVLAVFDPGTDADHINNVFSWSKCPAKEADRDKDYFLGARLEEVAANIKKLGGICIAAHVNSTRGLRTAALSLSFELLMLKHELRQLDALQSRSVEENKRKSELETAIGDAHCSAQDGYLECLIKSRIGAVQISKPDDDKHYGRIHTMQVGGDIPIACILAPDSHRLCDVGLPRYVTYIKMSRPSVAGLAKAFNDSATRIRFATTLESIPYPRIRGLIMSGPDSFFTRGDTTDSVAIGFADNLTCVIGGRGSGKSCIIEGIRHALGRKVVESESRVVVENYKGYLEHLFRDSTISLVYDCMEGSTLVAKRNCSVDGSPVVEELNGTRRHIPVEGGSELRVDIYGQSELEAVAKDKGAQRRLVDAFIPDASRLAADIAEVDQKFSASTALCVEKAKSIRHLSSQLGDLGDIKGQLELLQDPVLEPLIRQFAVAKDVEAFRLTAGDSVRKAGTLLEGIQEDLQCRIEQVDELLIDDVINTEAPFAGGVKPALTAIGTTLSRFVRQLDLFKAYATRTEDEIGELNEKIRKAKDDLVQSMKDVVSDDDKERLTEIIEKRQQLEEKYATLQPIEVKRDELLKDLWDQFDTHRPMLETEREEKTKLLYDGRNDAIQRIVSEIANLPGDGLEISVTLGYQADRSLFRRLLGESTSDDGFLKGNDIPRHKFDRMWAKHISDQLTSTDFALLLIKRDIDGLLAVKKDDDTVLLNDSDVDKLLAARSPFSENDRYDIDVDKLEALLEMADRGLGEDLPAISLAGRLVEELSPGQRCSALLPIILLSGDWPLVIDQPEDNLDNRHVFECLVEILRVLKHRRQIICATHNANIVVSGDAEQVIVCSGEDKDSGRILRQASIDDDDEILPSGASESGVVTYVKEIMEGGEKAFKTRARKYGFNMTAHPD